ncbi:hypothetical protein GGQ85_004414 [Nitrobacter vulgaris]|nr:hypothetical protein [Nitrobacter vulgaris]
MQLSFLLQALSLNGGGRAVHPIRWRKEFGGLKGDQVKRLKDLEKENDRLRKAVSDLTLEKLILKEAASGNFFSIRGA